MARLLVVEDEGDIRELLAMNLKADGHEVVTASDGAEGLTKCLAAPPDLLIADLMMPRLGGLELCRRLRGDARFKNLPIIMLTAKAEEIDRVLGFEMGADDYVTKPFSFRELSLRVRALLRRGVAEPALDSSRDESAPLNFGALKIDPAGHEVLWKGETIALTALEFKLLHYLASRPGRVLERGHLLEAVWGYHEENYARTVDTHIRRLRSKLGEAGDFVETVRGVGYKFRNPAAIDHKGRAPLYGPGH